MRVTESDDLIREPTSCESFLCLSLAMLEGIKALEKVEPATIALTYLCGHATEAALKAMLAYVGIEDKELASSKKFGHQLVKLWLSAASKGIPLQMPPPPWLEHLHNVHAFPYHLRYPLGFHVIVLPEQASMFQGVNNLIHVAAEFVN